MFKKFVGLEIWGHLIIGFILRGVLIIYGDFHDDYFKVSYTDVDYKVFSDGARCVIEGDSPYKRDTYRYSPILAFLMVPNVLIHQSFGKWFFSLFDVIAGYLIYKIVKLNSLVNHDKNDLEVKAKISSFFWLYNPSVFIISTRGNCDAISSIFVLLTIYLLQCDSQFLAGLIHGFVIHFRLYPLMYSLAYFMNQNSKTNLKLTKIVYIKYLIPNFKQLKLIFGTLLALISLTTFFYFLYGYQFLYETYIYHFIRKDTRHNFSLYFYLQYLSADLKIVNIWQRILTVLPQYLLITVLSIRYGLNKSSLCFSLFSITFVMITYNTVLTSQYFMWLMVILPLCLWQIKINKFTSIVLVLIWIVAQLAWLYPAYLLEFQGKNTFIFIWIQSVAFFSANIGVLGRIISCYKP
ncbi:uncharacterized protein [Onthophagus taurus]|uniref:uncharacterized protein n=1 Tax=Onthophagus taurus TaxID=166361 RepID=UPI0039BE9DA9